jgi:type I restriction enzyme S subunit
MDRQRTMPTLGCRGYPKYSQALSPAYVVASPRARTDSAYFAALFRTSAYLAEIDSASRGIVKDRNRLYWEQFKQMRSPCPPPEEQADIVRFLDWANGRLGRAIRAKHKVIALLDEQKRATIQRAVTRGIDPLVPLKPSRVPWLGDIPRHWEIRRLGQAVGLQTGYPFASSGFVHEESGTRLLRGVNVSPSGVRWGEVVRWQRAEGDGLNEFELEIGDIVLGMDRPIIGSGTRAAEIQQQDTPSLLLQRVARLRPTAVLEARFLLYLLRGQIFRDYIAPIFTGISVPHLSPEQIRTFALGLPPREEQAAIVEHLELETRGLSRAQSRLDVEIDLLREYRTRLVADVVTGKLDVREAARQLPDVPTGDTATEPDEEADEPELDDEEAAEA